MTTTTTGDDGCTRPTQGDGGARQGSRGVVPWRSWPGWSRRAGRDLVAMLTAQAETRVPSSCRSGIDGRHAVHVLPRRGGTDGRRPRRDGRHRLRVQLCGDAHLANFGIYGSPERNLVFDLNDFDETLPGPFEWDVKRLVTSLRSRPGPMRSRDKERRRILVEAGAAPRGDGTFADQPLREVWYGHVRSTPSSRRLAAS